MINSENARRAFIRRIGNLSCAEKEYFDLFHKELNPDEYIDAALNDCRGYFGTDNIPFAVTDSCVADIAYIRYQIDIAQSERPYGLKSASYSEGSVSKSETYSSDQELNTSIESILKPYSRFRVVSGHRKNENTE